jgi:subfamily B ATP-binding cassette protein MsbA
MLILSDLPKYLSVFQHYLGARIYIIFGLAVFAGVADGFGILLLLPLLETIDSSGISEISSPESGAALVLYNLLSYFDLQNSMITILILISVSFAVKGLLVFGALGYNAFLRGKLLKELKSNLFRSYSNMQYGYYTSQDTGYFINVLNEPINRSLHSFHAITQLGTHIISALIYLTLAYAVAWRFGLMALFVGIVMLSLFRWLNNFVRNLSRKTAAENGILSKLLIQTLHAFKYLTSTDQMHQLKKDIDRSIDSLASYEIKSGIAAAFTQAAREPIAVIFIMLIVLIQIVFLEKPLAPILVSIVLFYRGMNSIVQIQGYWQNSLEFIGSIELVHSEFSIQASNQEKSGKISIGPLSKNINFKNINFRYGDELQNVINNVNLDIPALSSVAFVGESGAGKSTIVDLLTLMLRPHNGSIILDNIDSNNIELSSWRKQIGYVSQDAVIFDDTIANNICLWQGNPQIDEHLMNVIHDAAKKAHLHEFILSLPDGYHTQVGDRGVRLSGGQKQRLFIARELFRKPNLLILDEATSALDTESEKAIQDSIDALKGELTVIIVAHRLSTIKNVDTVFVFSAGEIIEKGTFNDLKNLNNSKLSNLISMQEL